MIEVNSNALFLSTFGVKIDVKNERKRVSRMCENAYLSIKNPKASRACLRVLDPGRRLLTSLAQLRFATLATFGLRSWGPPLTKSWIRTWAGKLFLILISPAPSLTLCLMPFIYHSDQLDFNSHSLWGGGCYPANGMTDSKC